jgi:type IV secretion system protein VirD4
MSATKVLWGQVLLVGAVVLAFLWTATEWTAWQLGSQAQLGPVWFEVFVRPFYRPSGGPATRLAKKSGLGHGR